MLTLGRGKIPGFVLVALLVSLGTAASLVEPWIYRAIIDDVAGVFVEPAPLARVESAVESFGRHLQDLLMSVSKAGVLALGGYKAPSTSSPRVVLFLAYVDRVYEPIEGLTGLITTLQQHASSVRRARRLLEEPAAPGEDLPALQPRAGAVEFEDVAFSYGRRSRRVLDGVTFRLRAGERTALVGPSGAGKTTLTDLLVALYRPAQPRLPDRGAGQDRAGAPGPRAHDAPDRAPPIHARRRGPGPRPARGADRGGRARRRSCSRVTATSAR